MPARSGAEVIPACFHVPRGAIRTPETLIEADWEERFCIPWATQNGAALVHAFPDRLAVRQQNRFNRGEFSSIA